MEQQATRNISSERELIVITEESIGLRSAQATISSTTGANIAPLASFLNAENIVLTLLFGETEEKLQAAASAITPDLSTYYRVQANDDRLDTLAEQLLQIDGVAAAYVKPASEPPIWLEESSVAEEEIPAITPDFTARQGYLDSAPGGIDARYAWTQPGGGGAGVNIIDIEGAWRFSHEDLLQNQGGVVGGVASTDIGWRNHGTAVIGEFGGDRNTKGITGISPDAHVSAVSIFGPETSSARAIREAADKLRPGDIILLELHRPGPQFNFAGRADQRGYIAIEWWPDDFDAIRYAVSKGVIVVEAAGNGAENLDDPVYETRPAGFPTSWLNPFRRNNRDSGAVVVGAGAPPPGTHGNDHGPDRSRLGFSNWGALVDAQGWGREVTTAGYGDYHRGENASNEDEWYTDRFSGTSSASPIVVGALASTQGVLKARGRIPLSPARARELLRHTGSPQQDALPDRLRTQRIGNRPNLRQLIATALQTNSWIGVQFTGTLQANQTGRWFTFGWPAHWHVVWTVVPTSPQSGAPQIEWKVQVERATDSHVTYWINVTNLTASTVNIEGRFAVLGW
ncbi:S8 family serine peptidase [Thiothrix subterranea]|uniref:S8 family peptidase n=1 Tax=Thiothrix subterranea TaxID=2735563 RepID=UPI00192BC08A|nr:S8 family peptidase [Thiothrix subterranea]QQZ28036.1 S8 family serine peptidase [Thiothrix subterranea]